MWNIEEIQKGFPEKLLDHYNRSRDESLLSEAVVAELFPIVSSPNELAEMVSEPLVIVGHYSMYESLDEIQLWIAYDWAEHYGLSVTIIENQITKFDIQDN